MACRSSGVASEVSQCLAAVLMASDLGHCEKIKKACGNLGILCELRVTSAHKGPDESKELKWNMKGMVYLLNLLQWQAEAMVWTW